MVTHATELPSSLIHGTAEAEYALPGCMKILPDSSCQSVYTPEHADMPQDPVHEPLVRLRFLAHQGYPEKLM